MRACATGTGWGGENVASPRCNVWMLKVEGRGALARVQRWQRARTRARRGEGGRRVIRSPRAEATRSGCRSRPRTGAAGDLASGAATNPTRSSRWPVIRLGAVFVEMSMDRCATFFWRSDGSVKGGGGSARREAGECPVVLRGGARACEWRRGVGRYKVRRGAWCGTCRAQSGGLSTRLVTAQGQSERRAVGLSASSASTSGWVETHAHGGV